MNKGASFQYPLTAYRILLVCDNAIKASFLGGGAKFSAQTKKTSYVRERGAQYRLFRYAIRLLSSNWLADMAALCFQK